MKVLGLVAGPRKTGHTAALVEEILAGAKEAGHETIIYYLSDLEIKPLEQGRDGYIYPEDGFQKIMPNLESMNVLVLGTPIYYDQVSSRAKLFIDRLHYYSKSHGDEYRKKFPNSVKFISAVTYGWDKADAYKEVVDWLEGRMKNYWNMTVYGALKAYGTGNKPVKDNKNLLMKAKELGNSL